jgi:hypothetical protein
VPAARLRAVAGHEHGDFGLDPPGAAATTRAPWRRLARPTRLCRARRRSPT